MATTARDETGGSTGALPLRDAAVMYAVPLRTLRAKVSRGEIPGYKVRGLRGPEWRVTHEALEEAGLQARADSRDATARTIPAAAVDRELAEAWRIAWAERGRAAAADQELGHALLECGRLRAANADLERRLAAAQDSVWRSNA